jgi:hypothetical protein
LTDRGGFFRQQRAFSRVRLSLRNLNAESLHLD